MARVFISSTTGTLSPYRDAAIDACRRHGIVPVYMESFTSSTEPPIDVCRREVDTCNALLLLLADRYGARPPGEIYSYTELEYDWAVSQDIPILPFMATP